MAVPDYGRAVEAFERLVALRDDKAWRADKLHGMAKLYRDKLNDNEQAIVTLEKGIEQIPTSMQMLGDLRELLIDAGRKSELEPRLEAAKDELRRRVGADPLDADAYVDLSRAAEWSEDEYTLLATLGVLTCLERADEQERELYARRVAKTEEAGFAPRASSANAWTEAIATRGANSALGSLWQLIAETLPKLFVSVRNIHSDVGAFGLGRGDRCKAGDTRVEKVVQMADALGVSGLEVYVTTKEPDLVVGLGSDVATLVVGGGVLSRMGARERYKIGRTLALLRHRCSAIEALERDQVALVVAAAAHACEQSLGIEVSGVADFAKRLHKALSRKNRKTLPTVVARCQQENVDLDDWLQGELQTAQRAGLLICGDLLTALEQIDTRFLTAKGEQARRDVLSSMTLGVQLLPFSISRSYLGLRRKLAI
jgi:hypothetical protein